MPDLPPYDPDKDPKFDWEDDVAAAIEILKAEKQEQEEIRRKAEPEEDKSDADFN